MKKTYTQDEKKEFIDQANELGLSPAMRMLGYPGSHHTAARWFKEYGQELPDVSYLQRKARALKEWYSDKEELASVQTLMDRLVEALESESLDPDGLNKIANALQRAIQTKRLIEGKSTNVNESHTKDATELAIAELVREQASINSTLNPNSTPVHQ
jgi:hypothetical protein